MKKFLIIFFLSALFFSNSKANASDFSDGFLLKSAVTLDVGFPHIAGSGQNSQFKRDGVWNQIKSFENIAPGLHYRVHKYLGFNLNLSRFTMTNTGLDGLNLDSKAKLSVQNVNFTSLWYAPLVGDHLLEGFIELGVSDVQSKLKYSSATTGFVTASKHETVPLYGLGIQFAPYESDTVFRLTFQKYNTKLAGLNGDMIIWRAGVVQYF